MATEAGIPEDISGTPNIQVETEEVIHGQIQPPEHESKTQGSLSNNSSNIESKIADVQSVVSQSLTEEKDRHEPESGTVTVTGNNEILQGIAEDKTVGAVPERLLDVSEGEVLYKAPSAVHVCWNEISNDSDEAPHEDNLVEKQKDMVDVLQRDQVDEFKDKIQGLSLEAEKRETTSSMTSDEVTITSYEKEYDKDKEGTGETEASLQHGKREEEIPVAKLDVVPVPDDVETRETVETSMSGNKDQNLEPNSETKSVEEDSHEEELVRNMISNEENREEENGLENVDNGLEEGVYTSNDKKSLQMVNENKQKQNKSMEKEGSVDIDDTSASPEIEEKINQNDGSEKFGSALESENQDEGTDRPDEEMHQVTQASGIIESQLPQEKINDHPETASNSQTSSEKSPQTDGMVNSTKQTGFGQVMSEEHITDESHANQDVQKVIGVEYMNDASIVEESATAEIVDTNKLSHDQTPATYVTVATSAAGALQDGAESEMVKESEESKGDLSKAAEENGTSTISDSIRYEEVARMTQVATLEENLDVSLVSESLAKESSQMKTAKDLTEPVLEQNTDKSEKVREISETGENEQLPHASPPIDISGEETLTESEEPICKVLEHNKSGSRTEEESVAVAHKAQLNTSQDDDKTISSSEGKNGFQKEEMSNSRDYDPNIQKDDSKARKIETAFDGACEDVGEDVGSTFPENELEEEMGFMKNEKESLQEEEKEHELPEVGAECKHGDEDTKPDDVVTGTETAYANSEKLQYEAFAGSPVTTELVEEGLHDEEPLMADKIQSSISDTLILETADVRESGNEEKSTTDQVVKKVQTSTEEVDESLDKTDGLPITHKSIGETSVDAPETETEMESETLPKYQSNGSLDGTEVADEDISTDGYHQDKAVLSTSTSDPEKHIYDEVGGEYMHDEEGTKKDDLIKGAESRHANNEKLQHEAFADSLVTSELVEGLQDEETVLADKSQTSISDTLLQETGDVRESGDEEKSTADQVVKEVQTSIGEIDENLNKIDGLPVAHESIAETSDNVVETETQMESETMSKNQSHDSLVGTEAAEEDISRDDYHQDKAVLSTSTSDDNVDKEVDQEKSEEHAYDEVGGECVHDKKDTKTDDPTKGAETVYASSEKLQYETFAGSSITGELVEDYLQDEHTVVDDKSQSSISDILIQETGDARESEDDEKSTTDQVVKEDQSSIQKTDESVDQADDLPITHESTEETSDSAPETEKDMESETMSKYQRHDTPDEPEAADQDNSRDDYHQDKADLSICTLDENMKKEVDPVKVEEHIHEENNDIEIHSTNKEGSPEEEKIFEEGSILESEQAGHPSKGTISELQEKDTEELAGGYELSTGKESEMSDSFSVEESPKYSPQNNEKGNKLGTHSVVGIEANSELGKARGTTSTEVAVEQDDLVEAQCPLGKERFGSEREDQTYEQEGEHKKPSRSLPLHEEKLTAQVQNENLNQIVGDPPVIQALFVKALDEVSQENDGSCVPSREENIQETTDMEGYSVAELPKEVLESEEHKNTSESEKQVQGHEVIYDKDAERKENSIDTEFNKVAGTSSNFFVVVDGETQKETSLMAAEENACSVTEASKSMEVEDHTSDLMFAAQSFEMTEMMELLQDKVLEYNENQTEKIGEYRDQSSIPSDEKISEVVDLEKKSETCTNNDAENTNNGINLALSEEICADQKESQSEIYPAYNETQEVADFKMKDEDSSITSVTGPEKMEISGDNENCAKKLELDKNLNDETVKENIHSKESEKDHIPDKHESIDASLQKESKQSNIIEKLPVTILNEAAREQIEENTEPAHVESVGKFEVIDPTEEGVLIEEEKESFSLQNNYVVDSNQRKEVEESMDDEYLNKNNIVSPLTPESASEASYEEVEEKPEKHSSSLAMDIDKHTTEKEDKIEEVEGREKIDTGPAINNEMPNKENLDVVDPITEIETADSKNEDEPSNNIPGSPSIEESVEIATSEEVSCELEEATSPETPGETAVVKEDSHDLEEAETIDTIIAASAGVPNKEVIRGNLDVEDSLEATETTDSKDEEGRLPKEPGKETIFPSMGGMLEECTSSMASDGTSGKQFKEEKPRLEEVETGEMIESSNGISHEEKVSGHVLPDETAEDHIEQGKGKLEQEAREMQDVIHSTESRISNEEVEEPHAALEQNFDIVDSTTMSESTEVEEESKRKLDISPIDKESAEETRPEKSDKLDTISTISEETIVETIQNGESKPDELELREVHKAADNKKNDALSEQVEESHMDAYRESMDEAQDNNISSLTLRNELVEKNSFKGSTETLEEDSVSLATDLTVEEHIMEDKIQIKEQEKGETPDATSNAENVLSHEEHNFEISETAESAEVQDEESITKESVEGTVMEEVDKKFEEVTSSEFSSDKVEEHNKQGQIKLKEAVEKKVKDESFVPPEQNLDTVGLAETIETAESKSREESDYNLSMLAVAVTKDLAEETTSEQVDDKIEGVSNFLSHKPIHDVNIPNEESIGTSKTTSADSSGEVVKSEILPSDSVFDDIVDGSTLIHREKQAETSDDVSKELNGENANSNKATVDDGNSAVLASDQITVENIHPVEEVFPDKEVQDETGNDDLPVSQFLMDQILRNNLLDDDAISKVKNVIHEESHDVVQREIGIPNQEEIFAVMTENQVKGETSISEDNMDYPRKPVISFNSELNKGSYDVNEKSENENQDDTREHFKRLGDSLARQEEDEDDKGDHAMHEESHEGINEIVTPNQEEISNIMPESQIMAETSMKKDNIDCLKESASNSNSVFEQQQHDINEKALTGNELDMLEKIKELGVSHSLFKQDVYEDDKVHEESHDIEQNTNQEETFDLMPQDQVKVGTSIIENNIDHPNKPVSNSDLVFEKENCDVIKKAKDGNGEDIGEHFKIFGGSSAKQEGNEDVKEKEVSCLVPETANHNSEKDNTGQTPVEVIKAKIESDVREFISPDLAFNKKLHETIYKEEERKSEVPEDNEILDKNFGVLLATNTCKEEISPKEGGKNFQNMEEIQPNIEIIEKGVSEDKVSAVTETVRIKETESFVSVTETLQNDLYQEAEGLGFVVVEDQKNEEALQNEVKVDKANYTEENLQVLTEQLTASAKETSIEDSRESELSTPHPSGMQQASVKDTTHIADNPLEENSKSNKKMDSIVEKEKSGEEKEEKSGQEHITEESGLETPLMAEIREVDLHAPHKKHNNILSGVRSKVKHSISTVKKAITCSSSIQFPQ